MTGRIFIQVILPLRLEWEPFYYQEIELSESAGDASGLFPVTSTGSVTDVVSSRSDARRGSQQDNEGGAEREHIHIFIRRFAVGREEVVVQEKSHSVRGIDLEGQRHAGAEGETSG